MANNSPLWRDQVSLKCGDLQETAALCYLWRDVLRVDAFATRDSPYAFSGLGVAAFDHVKELRDTTSVAVVSEAASTEQVELLSSWWMDSASMGAT